MGRGKNKKANIALDKEKLLIEKEILRKIGQPNFSYFFLSPVEKGYIKYTDLINGGLTLFDLRKMNEAISYLNKVEGVILEFNQRKKNGSKIR